MNDSNFPVDWGEFEKQMLKQFPFLPKDFMNGGSIRNNSWVGDIVKKSIDRYLNEGLQPNVFNPFASALLSYDLFETHRSVILRLNIPKNMSPHEVKASVNRRKVRIELPSGKLQEIKLEKPVNPKRSQAVYKEGVLEVRMPKIREPKSFHEVYIEE
ncbi:Hsp20/alpha crystallin family protein [Paenibacillus thermotolerans]|uniref:Hsp20/alpha crystallin family protein n=1 Tax=Paenibacillus thermotolerans TaxID=3027807 RepID=UPI0023688FF0|nr:MULTISPECIES: Hsp20/alpha crystallin family protein [unclassified Paenibacillus]